MSVSLCKCGVRDDKKGSGQEQQLSFSPPPRDHAAAEDLPPPCCFCCFTEGPGAAVIPPHARQIRRGLVSESLPAPAGALNCDSVCAGATSGSERERAKPHEEPSL